MTGRLMRQPGQRRQMGHAGMAAPPWVVALAVWLAIGAMARGDDVVRAAGIRYLGKIVQMTSQEVTVATAVKNETIPVKRISA